MEKWKIIVVIHDKKLTYIVDTFQEREGRILFIDRVTEMPCNYPAQFCFIEKVIQ